MCSVVVLCYDQARQCASQSDMTQISVLGGQPMYCAPKVGHNLKVNEKE